MLSQTVDQVLPVLNLIQQPAFCLRQDGTVLCNPAAQNLAPFSGDDMPRWLGAGMELFSQWDRSSTLVLPVPLGGQICSVTVRTLADGTLFLLSEHDTLMAGSDALTVAAQVLRQPLSDLSALNQTIAEELGDTEDPLLLSQFASMTRQIYRLSRIACNLADLNQLRSGTYVARQEKMELQGFLQELTMELESLCRGTGRQLVCRLPAKPMILTADAMLLERAILNLISNALKYSRADTPITFRVDTTASAVIFQTRNACREEDSDLLSAAFQRIGRRGVLPDPQWGIGLGLPMVRYIAQLMGGTVAVEVTPDHTAVVTMSISRKKQLTEVKNTLLPPMDYTGGMRHSLVELSDILPDSCFDSNLI